jgi:5-methyltetrahydrofolate--homocysteine methyltransferase
VRDYLEAIRDRVVVFDGGMGATLEQFDSRRADYRLPGQAHEALVLNRPDVIEGVHSSMVEAGPRSSRPTPSRPRASSSRSGASAAHRTRSTARRPEIARRASARTASSPGSIGPTGTCPRRRPHARLDPLPRARSPSSAEQAKGLVDGGSDLLIIETAQDILEVKAAVFGAREASRRPAGTLPLQCSVSLLPNGGKMLLGTDIDSVLTTLEALKVDVIGLNCSTGPEDMRDAIRFLGEFSPLPVHCIPNAGLRSRARGRDDLPRGARPAGRGARRVRRPLRVGIVAAAAAPTPTTSCAIRERVGWDTAVKPRPSPGAACLLDDRRRGPRQEPRPTIVASA